MKTWLFVLGIVLSDSAGNILLTCGIRQVGERQAPARFSLRSLRMSAVLRYVSHLLRNRMLGLGILCLAIAFFLLIALLSWADLSFILPATALNYPLSLWGSHYFLKERTSLMRWIGTILVCIGVAFVSVS
jgi:drug/metabolite transporter (DMT)-like permease